MADRSSPPHLGGMPAGGPQGNQPAGNPAVADDPKSAQVARPSTAANRSDAANRPDAANRSDDRDSVRDSDQRFRSVVGSQEQRALRAQQQRDRTLWTGVQSFGAVGWAVAVPTLAGVALGRWLDRRAPSDFSWTLALLLAGLTVGCLMAWSWIQSERKQIDSNR